MGSSPSHSDRLAPTRRRAILLVAAVFVFFLAAYCFTASADYFGNGDTRIRINVADNLMGGTTYLDGWILQYPKHIKSEFYDARIWNCHGDLVCTTYLLGQPLVVIPFDYFGQQIAIHERWPVGPGTQLFEYLVGPLFGALEVALFFVFAVRVGYGIRRALLLTLVLGFATTVWPDEQSVLEHTEVAFFILLAMYCAFRFRDGGGGRLFLILSGAGIGGAAITRYQDAALGAVAVLVYLLWPGSFRGGWRRWPEWLVLLGLGILPFALLDMWWSYVRFGSLFASGHHESVFGYAPWLGAAGLLISPGKGLLWYCPTIFLLAIAGPRFARRSPAMAAGIAALFLGFVGLYANVTYWHGDPAWGPRYMYPVVPFLTLPLGELFTRRFRLYPAVWAITALVVAAGLTVQVAAVSVSQWRSWYRVIAYEENQGQQWTWISSRYRYFWDPHESPLNFQLHGLYQLAYDNIRHSSKYELVPPDEDPILDNLTSDYAINQWNFWWASNEYNWWMGEDKIVLGVVMLLGIMAASGAYVAAEAGGIFSEPVTRAHDEPLPEAA